MSDEDPTPPAARLLRDFVNTYEPQTGEETLTSADALRDWFADRHLVPPDAGLGPRDLALARTIREGLRSALLSETAGHDRETPGNGPEVARDGRGNAAEDRGNAAEGPGNAAEGRGIAGDGLNRAFAEVPVRLAYSPGGWHLEAAGPRAADRAFAALVDAVRQCTGDGTWQRLKVCARDTCHWAFFDASRNQVRRWCSMAGCGTHIKNKRA